MSSSEKMEELAQQIYNSSKLEKEFKDQREQAKQKLFELITDDFTHNDHLLPHRTIEIPKVFFDKTGMGTDEFAKSRFPGWRVTSYAVLNPGTTDEFIMMDLQRDPSHMNYSIEIETDDGVVKVAKEISEYTPSVDWDSLQTELPELFDKLAKRIEVYEIDEDQLDRLMEIEPEVLSKLQRHMTVRQPALKVSSRKVKSGEDDERRAG